VLTEFKKNKNIMLIAPTGYGKTILSLRLIEVAKEREFSSGLIHVVPYRALVREIYSEKFKGNYPIIGYQSLDEIEIEDKSPYYLRELVVTTLDSFIYNLYKIPVSEMYKIFKGMRTLGHYYPVLASIFTSTIVFDEAHIYLGSELAGGDEDEAETLSFMLAALDFLIQMNIPLIIETATMHSDVIAEIIDMLRRGVKDTAVIYVGEENSQIKNLRGKGVDVITTRDELFEEEQDFPWKTTLETHNSVLKYIEEICESEPALIIHNTVRRAVESYKELSKKCSNVILLHSLLSNKDREKALVRIRDEISGKKGVIVSTQVIEAGVDIGVRILVSEPAPIENLAQRAGRLCREKFANVFKVCREEGGEVHIIKGDPGNIAEVYNKSRVSRTLELIEKAIQDNKYAVNWRLLSTNKYNTNSFTEILEEISLKPLREVIFSPKYALAHAYLNSDGQADTLIRILDDFGRGLVRSSILINVLIPPYSNKKPSELEIVTVDFTRIMKRELLTTSKCLEYIVEDNKIYPKILLMSYDKGLEYIESKIEADLETINKKISRSKFTSIINMLTTTRDISTKGVKGIVGSFLIAKSECYDRGVGLKIW